MPYRFPRRRFLQSLLALGTATLGPIATAQPQALLTRPIPSTGEAMPVIGLGTWITFNVGRDRALRASSTEVVRNFLAGGGRMIDSSPMYGSAQEVVGEALEKLGRPQVFAADKVWTSPGARGPAQIEESRRNWGIPGFDLLQVHNLLSWEEHLKTLFGMKAAGQLRYVGITTSEGRRHEDIERIMRNEPIDFVQVTYNPLDREVESRILPLAIERRIAVIANRPFRQGALIRRVQRRPLPDFAAEIDCANWAQFLLKFIVSHPAVTCVIPATTRVEHVRQNLGAGFGRQPDAAMRRRIVAAVEAL
jgi:diketogulonate reductase-like aldo/keto reductase